MGGDDKISHLGQIRSPFGDPALFDLYDLRDLDHVFRLGSVRSSSYTQHVGLGGICMMI